jgi:ankyrin repeat protein
MIHFTARILLLCTLISINAQYDPLNKTDPHAATFKLFRAAWTGKIESAHKAIQRGAVINYQFLPDNKTALIIAVRMKRYSIVELLLKHNAAVNYQTLLGRTALEYALAEHEFNIAQQLINHGASPHIVNFWGESPSSAAYAMDDFATIHFLNYGLRQNNRSTNNETNTSGNGKRTYKSIATAQLLYGPALPPDLPPPLIEPSLP